MLLSSQIHLSDGDREAWLARKNSFLLYQSSHQIKNTTSRMPGCWRCFFYSHWQPVLPLCQYALSGTECSNFIAGLQLNLYDITSHQRATFLCHRRRIQPLLPQTLFWEEETLKVTGRGKYWKWYRALLLSSLLPASQPHLSSMLCLDSVSHIIRL